MGSRTRFTGDRLLFWREITTETAELSGVARRHSRMRWRLRH